MKNSFFKTLTILMAALALVVGTMTGLAGAGTEEVKADDEQTVHVYYDLKNVRTKTEFYETYELKDKLVIFIPSNYDIDFTTSPCLPVIPAGSALQVIADYETKKTANTITTCFSDTPASSIEARSNYYPVGGQSAENLAAKIQAYVVTVEKGAGFDSCKTGFYGLGDMSAAYSQNVYLNNVLANDNRFLYYGCDGSGVSERECPGNVVLYSEADVPISAIDAMVKPSKGY